MKIKHLAISILVLLMSCLAIVAQPTKSPAKESGAVARNVAEPLGGRGTPSTPASPDAASIVVPADVLLKIRELQLKQASRQVDWKVLESQVAELQKADSADAAAINAIVREFEQKNNIDGTKWVLDLTSAKFVPRPASKDESAKGKEPSPPKPTTAPGP